MFYICQLIRILKYGDQTSLNYLLIKQTQTDKKKEVSPKFKRSIPKYLLI